MERADPEVRDGHPGEDPRRSGAQVKPRRLDAGSA